MCVNINQTKIMHFNTLKKKNEILIKNAMKNNEMKDSNFRLFSNHSANLLSLIFQKLALQRYHEINER